MNERSYIVYFKAAISIDVDGDITDADIDRARRDVVESPEWYIEPDSYEEIALPHE